MKRLCIINVVGLTRELLAHAPRISSLGVGTNWASPVPAVTCTSQATMLTGLPPREHGIVGNGWYFRDTQEIRFWQQANSLVNGPKLYEGIETAKLFWWFNQSAPVRYSVTPKPHYGCDGSKTFDILDHSECQLVDRLGSFPFFSFWGPSAGLACSQWIAEATAIVLQEKRPELTLTYLPHLDYDFQRFTEPDLSRVAEVDNCAGQVIDAARAIDATPIVVSEYGIAPVHRSVTINRTLRNAGWVVTRNGPYGEMLMPGESVAFAVCDHQIAHIYVRDHGMINEVRSCVSAIPGVADVDTPGKWDLDHARAGELVAIAEPDAWFAYYYWLDDALAPDFARTVDIHRKPGYDPCELFMTSKPRAIGRLLQKKLGFRYRMDVIPLDPGLVGGSHGLLRSDSTGAVIIGPDQPPSDMRGFKDYVHRLLEPKRKGGSPFRENYNSSV